MKRIKAVSAAIIFALVFCGLYSAAQNSSNQGKEFWTAYMSHQEDNGASRMSVYITADVNTSGVVESADKTFSIPFTVEAKKITTVDIPHTAFIKSQSQSLKGIHITSLKNVAVYAHIYAQSVSGATLLLPVNALGKDYYSLNYKQESNSTAPSYSTFAVIGTEENTTVEITPSNNLRGGQPASTPFIITLQKGEVFQGLSLNDLTKTRIRTISTAAGDCKKIAVFSGSTKIGIGCHEGRFTSDNLFQQVYPTSSWGKNYVTVPLKNRNYDIFRVVVSSPGTTLKVNGKVINPDYYSDFGYYEFESQQANIVTADQPIQVIQYAVTQGQVIDSCEPDADDAGDPEMIYLTPVEQTLDHVTLYSTPYFGISSHYINVVIKKEAASTFMLDGGPVPADQFKPVADNPAYVYAQLSVRSGTHYISATDGFNAIAYGFGEAESYGYAAGANLKNLNEFIVLGDKAGTKTSVNGCAGIEYKLQLTIPYQTTNIKWNINEDDVIEEDKAPVVVSTSQKDGKTLYTYQYKSLVTFAVGDHQVTATVLNPVADECGSTTDIDFDFNIAEYPESKLAFAGACVQEEIAFTDQTDAHGSTIQTWLWDFGDGQTSALQNPKHTYADAGKFNVTLTTTNENGCSSTSEVVPVTVLKKPVADFQLSGLACLNQTAMFNDKSVAINGTITQWVWDFGDGTPVETHTDNTAVTHIYATAGDYKVTLTVIGSSGCTSVPAVKDVSIRALPVVDFLLPDVCLNDATAQFTDKSAFDANGDAGFTYHWNFGDNNASGSNANTSSEHNPNHKYTRADYYVVTLTITSPTGCQVTKTIPFTVNGSTPAARFAVENQDKLCSSNPIIFKDVSTVDFGNVTKVVWYFDYQNNPQTSETFTRDNMPADRTYNHSYETFNAPATKTYNVRMEAYSGETCVNVTEQDVVIKANPIVTLSATDPICQGAAPVQILANTNGYTGAGVFAGKGVSASGKFDPNAADVGINTITYTFTSENDCSFTTTQNITVYPAPTADAGENTTMLEGSTILLKASAGGNGLTYKWTPSTGLDHDDVLHPAASPVESITYKLTVTNANGCSTSDDVFINVLKLPVVVNAFTPNNDGVNDTWNIKYLQTYPGNTVDIYNRYGEKVYSSVGYAVPWDGRYKGADLPAGTYYYIINPKNGRKAFAGYVTIIR